MDKKNKDWINNLAKNYKIPNVNGQKEPSRILTENQIKTIKESK